MSKRIRPWDKKRLMEETIKRKLIENTTQATTKTTNATTPTTQVPVVPYIEIHGIPYYSDRFYLNRTVWDEEPSVSLSASKSPCPCGGGGGGLPLFDRAAFIRSLDLQAVAMATYSVEPEWLVEEFPSLFGLGATIPTLVLHGRRGGGGIASEACPLAEEATMVMTESTTVLPVVANHTSQETKSHSFSPPKSHPRSSPAKTSSSNVTTPRFPSTVHWTEVTSSVIPSPLLSMLHGRMIQDNGSLTEGVLEKRIYHKGVHHPKFMLLLESSGSMIVLVSTANLTRPQTIDATWVQRFPPKHGTVSPSTRKPKSSHAPNGGNDDDWGMVLTDFLRAQMLASRRNQLTTAAFLHRYANLTLRDMERNFDYSQAQVYLIPTVPGTFQTTKYGRQRVQYLLQRHSQGDQAWLPEEDILHDTDRLVIQPTSLGAKWTMNQLAQVGRSYLCPTHAARPAAGTRTSSDRDLIQHIDIVWPTQDLIEEQRSKAIGSISSPKSVKEDMDTTTSPVPESSTASEESGYLFLSSETFNDIDLDCISQMVLYEPITDSSRSYVPHIKGIARLFNGNDYSLCQKYGVAKCQEFFPWFLLTSACLSLGAQGVEERKQASSRLMSASSSLPSSSTLSPVSVTYSNFELGVLFVSRLQGNRLTDRIYGLHPRQHCSCHRSDTSSLSRTIHLPIPYGVRPRRYQPDPDEAEFSETPYFHEIMVASLCVGNMRLTPLGATMAALEEEGKNRGEREREHK